MKIALLNPTFLMRRPIAELARLLANHGHKVTVIWPMDRQQSQTNQRHFDKLLKDTPGITILPIWSKEIKAILWSYPTDFSLFKKIYQVGKTHDLMQVWAPFYILPLLPFIMKRFGLLRTGLIGVYDTIPSYSFSMGKITDKLFRIFFALFTRPFLNVANRTAVYSPLLTSYAVKAGFSGDRIAVLPTGVDVEVKPATEDIRKELSIPKERPIILFIGLLNKRKGVYRILTVAENLRQRNIDAQIVMVGQGPEAEEIEKQIVERGLAEMVIMLGHRKDVPNFYHAAQCFFLPADGEGLPGVVMEAMSYGRAVVASDIPCIPDLIKQGQSGFLHPAHDTEAFTTSIIRILTDTTLRKAMEKRALQEIAGWSWNKRYPLYEQLYSEVISV